MRQPSITIIGAGFGGIGTAIELTRAGLHRRHRPREGRRGGRGLAREHLPERRVRRAVVALLVVVRAQPRAGRTATPARTRSSPTSSAPPASYGVLDLVRTGVEVTSAAYDETARSWHLTTADGEDLDTDVLITAVGQLSRPAIPAPARDRHLRRTLPSTPPSGTTTSTWRASGSRCSAPAPAPSSSCPASSPEAAHVTVFQRSAPYVAPKPDREYTRTHTGAFTRFPRDPGLRPRA